MTKVMNVAMIGGGFMGKAHAMAYASMPMFFWPAPAIPHRKVIVDMLASAGGLDGNLGVEVVRGADIDHINIRPVYHGFPVT